MQYPVSEKRCKGCPCCSLVTMTPAGVAHLKEEDYYYQCLAMVEDECGEGEENRNG